MNIREAQLHGRKELSSSPSPNLDVDCLLQTILNCDKTHLMFHREDTLSEEQISIFKSYLNMRKTGLPIAYITGTKEFYGRNFYVTPDVLIPKPDTELLVEKALEIIESKSKAKSASIMTICDMCTGSGCVAISIAAEIESRNIINPEQFPSIIMADISEKALDIARENARRILSPVALSKIKFVRTNLFLNIGGTFDLIISNPPYIPYDQTLELLIDGRNEPVLALNGDIDIMGNPTGDNDGLGIIRNLVPQAYQHLAPDGVLIVESGEYNAIKTQYIFDATGFKNTEIFLDLEGQLRDTIGYK